MKEYRGQHEILVMKDRSSKKQAIEQGTVSLEKFKVSKEEFAWNPQRP